jgi:DNA-binding transcriptional LysR family regulator
MTDLVAEPLVCAVAEQHPGVNLRLVTAYSGHLQRWLDDGDIDVTLLYNLKSSRDLNVAPVARERLWVAAPADADLDAEAPIDLRAVGNRPLVVPGPGHGLRVLIDEAAARADVDPQIVVETNSMHVQKRLVRAGHGWTILPGIGIAEDVASGRLSGAPLRDPAAFRDIVMAVPRFVRTRPAVDAIAKMMMEQLYRAIQSGAWPSATWRSTPAT